MIIDSHGHYTTAPAGMQSFRAMQVTNMGKPVKHPVNVSDDQIMSTLDNGQLRLQNERGTDLAIFSPRASAMGHHFGNKMISRYWTEVNNELIDRVCKLYPDRFVGVCSLPQSPGVPPIDGCVEELERCVKEFDFIGCNLNPDPSGGWWQDPPLGDEYWYPLYEKMVELDVPAMIHGSASCNPAFHMTGAHYLNVDTTGVVQILESRIFEDFPTIRFIIPHGGGAIPFQFPRFRGLAMMNGWMPFEELCKKLYFDTAIYDQSSVEYLIQRVGVDNVLFASEMIGGVQGIDPNHGREFDDTRPYVDDIDWLSDEDKKKIFETNVQKVYPRLKPHLERIAASKK